MDKKTTLLSQDMRAALKSLDELLVTDVSLIIGGGGAMLLAHGFPLATTDIDAVPKGISFEDLKPLVERVAREQGLPVDWLNPWFSGFTHVLPADFRSRTIQVFKGKRLHADALGREDLLLMKCFAHREKDVAHARALFKAGADVLFVQRVIETLAKKKIPGTEAALDFLDRILDLETP
jgi:hypothetical protein